MFLQGKSIAGFAWRAISFFLMLPVIVAKAQVTPTSGSGLENPLKTGNSLAAFLEAILVVVRNIGFVVAVFFTIYAGFLFVSAQGNEQQLTKAKKTLMWVIVGAAILLGAQILASAIRASVENVGGTGQGN